MLLSVLADGSPKVDTFQISRKCAMNEETVEEALLYWNSVGVIEIAGKEGGRLREYSDVHEQENAQAASAEREKKTPIRYSPSDLQKLAESSEDIKNLFSSVQHALSRTISSTEQAAFVDIYEYYGFPVASVILLTQYCNGIGKGTMAYIRSVAKDWHERGIIRPKDVEQEVIRLEEYHSYESEVKRALGLAAKTTKRQQEYYTKWQSMDIPVELVELAGEISIDNTDSHTVKLNYIDKILQTWKDSGIENVQQAQESLKQHSANTKNNVKNSENGKSYDIDELESFFKDYKPKLSDKK